MPKDPILPRHVKNLLNGSKNPHSTLSGLRSTISPRLYRPLLAHLPAAVRDGSSSLTAPFPKTYESLVKRQQILEPLPLQRELLWMAERIALHAPAINRFLMLKTSFEQGLLAGDAARGEEVLDTIEGELGLSFFLIETRLAFIQLTKGLEHQKRVLAGIRASCSRGITPFIAYYLSQKNESATNPIAFPEGFISILNRYDFDSGLADYLIHRVLRFAPTTKNASNLLLWEQNTALIDQYETLISVLDVCSGSAETVYPALPILRAHVKDPRLERLAALSSQVVTEGIAIDLIQLKAEELLESEAADASLSLIKQARMGASNPGLISVEAACRADLSQPVTTSYAPASHDHLVHLLYRVIAKEGEYDDSLFELVRLTECFPSMAFSRVLRPTILAAVTDQAGPFRKSLISAFVAAPFLSLEFFGALPPDLQALLRDKIDAQAAGHQQRIQPPNRDVPSVQVFNAPTEKSRRLRNEEIRVSANCLLDAQRIEEALDLIATSYIHDRLLLRMLPIARCASLVTDELASTLARNLSLPIVYDLYLRHVGDDRPYIRNDAYEDFLLLHGCQKPSELVLPLHESREEYLIYYLSNICTPEVMLNSSAFSSSKELEDERLRILTLLRRLNPANASQYDTEIRDITREQIVQQGLRHVEQSKFAMDTQPIRRWADKNLRESFARCQDLIAAGITSSGKLIQVSSNEKSSVPITPTDEIAATLEDVLAKFLKEAYTNAFYGLDSYLSMRARHGSFAGQIRAGFEEQNIITQRDASTDEYKSNITWLSRMEFVPGRTEKIDEALKDFSKQFDQVAQKFSSESLQIRSLEKPEGLFTYSIVPLDLFLLTSEASPGNSFDRFIELCFTIYWENIEQSTARVRSAIDQNLKPDLERVVRNLMATLERLRGDSPELDDLINAVRSAQTNLHTSLESLKEWFQTPKPLPSLVYSMDQIIDISLQQVKRLHPDFEPNVTREVICDLSIIELPRFSDIFFIIFDNIQRHSGVGKNPQVYIEVAFRDKYLQMKVVNSMKSRPDIQEKLRQLRAVIAAGQYQRVVRSEGGTGLVKLWNTIRDENSALSFEASEDRFMVSVTVPITILAGDGVQIHAHSPS